MSNIICTLKMCLNDLPEEILKQVDSVYLYGSMARGNNTDDSDCDILFAIADCCNEKYEKTVSFLKEWHTELNIEVAMYTVSMLREMWKKGSLFLWHIKLEGIVLYSSGEQLSELLANLPEYQEGNIALDEYNQIIEDIREDEEDISIIEYNLSLMATLIRNTCIICCYYLKQMHFGRIQPVSVCLEYFNSEILFSLTEYNELYSYRIAQNRCGIKPSVDNISRYYIYWIRYTRYLLDLASKVVGGK